ncbi:hypothetical protein ACHAXS_013451 [Conticribra weissflogii]
MYNLSEALLPSLKKRILFLIDDILTDRGDAHNHEPWSGGAIDDVDEGCGLTNLMYYGFDNLWV